MRDNIERGSLEYSVLQECVNWEELFVLFWLVDSAKRSNVDKLLETIASLLAAGLLAGRRGTEAARSVSFAELRRWTDQRVAAGEALNEVPGIGLEGLEDDSLDYAFKTTSAGLQLLDDEDKPIDP